MLHAKVRVCDRFALNTLVRAVKLNDDNYDRTNSVLKLGATSA